MRRPLGVTPPAATADLALPLRHAAALQASIVGKARAKEKAIARIQVLRAK